MIGTDICTRGWAKRLRFEHFRCGWLVSRGALLVVGGAGAHCMEQQPESIDWTIELSTLTG